MIEIKKYQFESPTIKSDDWNGDSSSGWTPIKFSSFLLHGRTQFGYPWLGDKITEKMVDGWLHHNKGLKTAYKKGYEIWFECKKYYFISSEDNYAAKVLKELKL